MSFDLVKSLNACDRPEFRGRIKVIKSSNENRTHIHEPQLSPKATIILLTVISQSVM